MKLQGVHYLCQEIQGLGRKGKGRHRGRNEGEISRKKLDCRDYKMKVLRGQGWIEKRKKAIEKK